MVNSFTFYYDYYNLIDTLPAKDKSILLVAITDYVFKDIEPNLEGHNQAIFNTLKAQLNVSKSNSKRRTKKEPEENRKKTGKKPKQEPEENKTSISSFKFYILNLFKDRGLLRGKIFEWLEYKKERKENYTEIGFKKLLTQINNNVIKYGEQAVMDLIDECMANNWKGIIFDKLKNDPQKKPNWYGKDIAEDKATEEEIKELNLRLGV